jgi:hypothetical protein
MGGIFTDTEIPAFIAVWMDYGTNQGPTLKRDTILFILKTIWQIITTLILAILDAIMKILKYQIW